MTPLPFPATVVVARSRRADGKTAGWVASSYATGDLSAWGSTRAAAVGSLVLKAAGRFGLPPVRDALFDAAPAGRAS